VDAGVFAPYQPDPPSRRAAAAPVAVRVGTVADVPGCLALVDSVLRLDLARWERSLTASATDPDRMLHVADDGGRIVGYSRATYWERPPGAPANAAPTGWYLIGLVVDPAYRRRGIGRALTEIRLAAIAARASEVWYFANARNRSSLELHSRLGFTEVTRDFWFPELSFEGGEGVLARARL